MKTTATTEAVSSPLEENELWSQQWRQNTSHAGQKPRADWKNVLQIPGAGRKSRKPPTPFVGYKPNGKSQIKSVMNIKRAVVALGLAVTGLSVQAQSDLTQYNQAVADATTAGTDAGAVPDDSSVVTGLSTILSNLSGNVHPASGRA